MQGPVRGRVEGDLRPRRPWGNHCEDLDLAERLPNQPRTDMAIFSYDSSSPWLLCRTENPGAWLETARPGRGPTITQGRNGRGSAQGIAPPLAGQAGRNQSQLTGAICVHLDAQDPDVGAPDAHAHPVSAPAGSQAKLLNRVDAHDGDPVSRNNLVTQVPKGKKGQR